MTDHEPPHGGGGDGWLVAMCLLPAVAMVFYLIVAVAVDALT